MDKVMSNSELKLCLVDILSDFADYCDEHNLIYMLSSGTLLGAVRHKGFIPWDDDIDVYMPREDYKRLHELVKKHPIKSNYVLESLDAGNSPYPFAKIVDTNTKIVNSKSSLLKNLWIDIFPLDGLTDSQVENNEALQRKLTVWIRMLGKSSNKIEWRGLKTTAAILLGHLHKPKYYGKKIASVPKHMNLQECDYAANIVWGGAYLYLKKEVYCEFTKLEFEGKLYRTPKDYDTVLRRLYGDDYMELPPEDQRDTHNIEAIRIK